MKTNMLASARSLSNQDLLDRLPVLAGNERHSSVELVAHLAALQERPSLYEGLGFGSLFEYCTVPVVRPSRHIPSEVKRAVSRRDAGQCAFVSPEGRRCTQRAFLEFHHVQPFAKQGPATVANISLRCRAHNGYEAELIFGRFDPSLVREARAEYVAFGNDQQVPEPVDAQSGMRPLIWPTRMPAV